MLPPKGDFSLTEGWKSGGDNGEVTMEGGKRERGLGKVLQAVMLLILFVCTQYVSVPKANVSEIKF